MGHFPAWRLAICKRLVKAMGGRIWVNSRAGEGASFHFPLPTEVARPPASAPPEVATLFDRTFAERRPLRILLAEDNVVNQKVARAMLKGFGYQADVAGNGLEATRAILALGPAVPRPRIVGLSANAMAEDLQAALQAGMDDYLAKPMTPGGLRGAPREVGAPVTSGPTDAPMFRIPVTLDDKNGLRLIHRPDGHAILKP